MLWIVMDTNLSFCVFSMWSLWLPFWSPGYFETLAICLTTFPWAPKHLFFKYLFMKPFLLFRLYAETNVLTAICVFWSLSWQVIFTTLVDLVSVNCNYDAVDSKGCKFVIFCVFSMVFLIAFFNPVQLPNKDFSFYSFPWVVTNCLDVF